jgi:hypothetical protein
MKKLQVRKIEWLEKLREGDDNYVMISRKGDQWYFVTQKCVEQIYLLRFAIDEGDGLRREYVYDIDMLETDALDFTAIIKGERELLLEDGNGLVAFGIEGVEAPAKGIFIYFRTERRHVFLFGSRESCSVHNLDALPPKQLEDDVYVIEDIFSTNYETRCMVGFNEEADA